MVKIYCSLATSSLSIVVTFEVFLTIVSTFLSSYGLSRTHVVENASFLLPGDISGYMTRTCTVRIFLRFVEVTKTVELQVTPMTDFSVMGNHHINCL